MTVHEYRSSLSWEGSTQDYERHERSHDVPIGQMAEADRPMRVARVVLRPHVTVRGAGRECAERLLLKAHDQCYIANSLSGEVVMVPTVEVS